MSTLTALSLFFSSFVPLDESLIPGVPTDWKRERLEFPLSFAPELDYRGHEDLAFAPGMFTKGSDSYFTYALAWRFDGDVRVDETMLAQFLETYFRGLCREVAKARNLERDAKDVHARVRTDGGELRATIDLFDAFTDGSALTLDIAIATHATPHATEILGLASPLARDAAVWRELAAIGKAWRDARPAAVYLNHVFAVVDRDTYDAIARSKFLREEFAVSEERETVRADLTYKGLYFYGRRTYFEFLPIGAATSGFAAGGTGIGFGVEVAGGNESVASRVSDANLEAFRGPITRTLDGAAVPWFDMLALDSKNPSFQLFVMEYDSRFLAAWHADLGPVRDAVAPARGAVAPDGAARSDVKRHGVASQGVARADVLERYAAALGRSSARETAPFSDVRAVELALSDAERERFLAWCAAAGFEVEARADAWTCRAPQCRFDVVRSDGPGGIRRFELELARPVAHEPLQLGKLRVSFDGARATVELAGAPR